MNKVIEKLYQVQNGGELSALECQEINRVLAAYTIEEIPISQHENVEDYLINNLNMRCVEEHLVEALESLLTQLQKSA